MLPNSDISTDIGLSADGMNRLYHYIQSWIDEGHAPGAAVGIARNGCLLSPRGFGRMGLAADAAPLPPDAIFLTASVTKPVSCAAVALLIERGLLTLNTHVASILPAFGQHGKDQVTVHHLMTHTSGLPDMIPENIAYRQRQAPLDEFIARIYTLDLLFESGTDISYQSTGIAILGEIVRQITDKPLPVFLDEEIFEPLGMNDSSLGNHRIDVDRVALIDVPDAQLGEPWNWNEAYWRGFGAPWGGMFATVADINSFTQKFLHNGLLGETRIFQPETITSMITDQTSSMPHIKAEVREKQSWGLGWRLNNPSTSFSVNTPPSSRAFGHYGATGTMVWADPETGLSCAVFTTKPDFCESDAIRQCSDLVMDALIR